MTRFPFLAQRLFNTPVAIQPQKAEVIMAALAERLGVSQLLRANGEAVALVAPELGPQSHNDRDQGYDMVENIAVIPVTGTLVQKNGTLRPYSGMTGYDGIRVAFLSALADKDVRAIVLDIDSPGGEVAGCFDLVDTIHAARGAKPIHAILNESAYSAAYAIASAADRITVPRTGGVGSIGVIALCCDLSKALTSAGITVNVIQYGARKADGLDAIPLAPEARARFQADVDTMGELFVETVARNRDIPASAIRATEATTYLGAAGVSRRLADAVMAPDAAFRKLLSTLKD